ncbi:helix-turn-helix domain-containing protein [Erythrobacter ani]|uniref:DUF4019 domain-containing protein n=1 Tax=Erythrobacter ani TaxID=2827235 RepID=A0ABS6SR55_9SPHN|nr:DUF4019 domain-containing protein [Erythrobacter ani]MBV7266927.1 DUF4019 domain-containing protein [Erythrobacter ani]
MNSGIADLTEKEKEALRLLLVGHDAKSSARQLDLSVHTINDRLRNARRKLGVSSSREAARILGDAEGADPHNIAHTSFGIAETDGAADTADLTNTKSGRPIGFAWLTGGMLIMSIVIAAAIIGVVYTSGEEEKPIAPAETSASSQSAVDVSPDNATPAAVSRANAFLSEVDAGNWDGSWQQAGDFFQAETTADEWGAVIEPVRGPLGQVEDRRLASVQQLSTLPGAPEGDYEVFQYQTKFSGRDLIAVETVVLIKNESGFDIAGYFIR